jgi:hypothetical protein
MMTSVAFYQDIGRSPDPLTGARRAASGPRRAAARAGGAAPALILAVAFGCAGCSHSDRFVDAQIDYQLRQGESPSLDLGQVGPANWSRACVLPPFTDDARAAALLGFPWPAARLTSIDRRDDVAVLVFTDGAKVLAFAERRRADGDFSALQPPCVTRDAARLTTRRAPDGRLVLQGPSLNDAAGSGAPRSPP